VTQRFREQQVSDSLDASTPFYQLWRYAMVNSERLANAFDINKEDDRFAMNTVRNELVSRLLLAVVWV